MCIFFRNNIYKNTPKSAEGDFYLLPTLNQLSTDIDKLSIPLLEPPLGDLG